uniref:TGF_BETA_2 domain-containing protein n=1 Tax=Meloidogyne hapla TaxID=6305 RepID=A0A1I8BMP4_MELHA
MASTLDASSKVTFSLEEQNLLRKAFLNKFGLSHLDGWKRLGNSTPKVPGYIWKLYRSVQQRREDFTTILHYSSYSLEFMGNGHARLTFNLSSNGKISDNEIISYGQLRLPNWKEASITVSMDKHDKTSTIVQNGIDFEKRPWVDLDGKLIATLFNNQKLNLLLHFPPDIPINNVEYMLEAAALLVYGNDKGSALASEFDKINIRKPKQRIKRSLSGTIDNESSKSEEDASSNTSQQKRRRLAQHRHRQHNSGSACRRADLYVDFGQLNWQDWIVAPSRCSHPLPSHLNSSNHAIMQSLLHSIDPGAALAPSCVPVQMSSITILYRDINNNALVVKGFIIANINTSNINILFLAYADMRVDACGCQ